MDETQQKKGSVHLEMDRTMIIRLISIGICVIMLVGLPIAASAERTKLNAHPHELSETIVETEATCTADGVAYKECQYEGCDYREEVELLATDHHVEDLNCTRCNESFQPYFEVVDDEYQVYVYGQPLAGYTGFVTYEGEQWYTVDGVRNTEYTGLYHTDDVVYYISEGKVQTEYNDYYFENGKRWYVKEGIAYDYYCGDVEFTWPTPSCWLITSYFGLRDQPTAGASTDHNGIDIGAMSGATIVAVADGTVVEAGTHELKGNYVYIQHEGGLKSVYLHCSEVYVSAGETVEMGEKIAAVGSTGVSTGPHLHFTIYHDGTPVNPLFYLPY